MVDFDKFDGDTIKDTFRLLDDFNEEGFNWRDMRIFSQPADEYIENFFSRRRQKSRTEKILPHLEPELASTIKKALDTEDDFDNDVYSFTKNKFRRSESSYSTTSGYETSSSNETISEEVNDRRRESNRSTTPSQSTYSSRCSTPQRHKYSTSSSASTPFRNNIKPPPYRSRTQSNSRHDSDLSKKFEKQFMKDERHSMPHEIYSERSYTPDDKDRPHSVPVNSAKNNDDTYSEGSENSLRFFPGASVNSSRDSLCSEPLDRFMSRLSSFSSGSSRAPSYYQDNTSSRASSIVQESRTSSPKQNQNDLCSGSERNSKPIPADLPDVLKGDPNGPHVRHIPIAMPDKGSETWTERQGRIEDALKWLRTELVGLRAQDKVLLSQLKRCHDTIEDLKKQRSSNSDGEDEDEEGHWEDWEIAEFEKRYAENPELAEDLFNLKKKKETVKQDVEAEV